MLIKEKVGTSFKNHFIDRFILVVGSSFGFSINQRIVLENFILLAILLISLNLTGWAIYYREDYRYYLSKVKS